MHTRRPVFAINRPSWGALQIAGLYLLLGGLWILFSDRVATRIATSQQMLTTMSTYKGWGYVLVTALLLYWLIRRHTAAVHASEQQLQNVIDAMPAFISYVGADQRYRYTNKMYKEWFDDQPEGKLVEEILGKAAYQTVSKYIDRVLSGELTTYETDISFGGQELFVRATYIPDKAPDGRVKGFFVLVQNLTEQRQAQEEQQLWADAFEGCAHGIVIGDPATHRVVVCNPAFASLHKCRVEDIVGSSILSLYAPSDHEHVRRQIEKADQIGHVRFEAHMIRKDGSIFPVQMDVVSVLGEDGELLYRVTTAQDISERKSIDEKLRASETKYRTLVEHLPAITYISEPEKYIGVSYISPQIETLGFDSNDWLTEPDLWWRQIHPDDKEQVESELQRFQAGAETFKAEYRLLLPDGETRWFHDESIRIKDQSGKTLLKQGFMLDITEHKQAEEKLRKSEERYHYLFENNPHPMWVYDRQTLAFLDVNESAISKYGYSRQEFLGMTIADIRPPEDRDRLMKYLSQSRQPLSHSDGWQHRLKDGTLIDVEITSHAIEMDGHASALVVAVDVTERNRAVEALRRSEALLLQTGEMAKVGGWELDLQTRKLVWSRETYRIHEIDPSHQPDVESAINYYAPEAQPIIRHAVEQAIEEGQSFDLELPLITAKGKRIWVRAIGQADFRAGKASRIFGTFQDITERRQAEEYLRRFELLSEHSRDIILFIGREDGHILEANAAAIRAYGYNREELLTLDIQQLRANSTQRLTSEQMAQADAGGILFETMHRRRDGTTFPVEVSSQGATIGGTRMLISIVRDITERKQVEETLQLKDELLRLTSEIAKVGGWEFDPRTGTGTWTDEVAKIHDLDPAQETNVEIGLSFYVGESREQIERALKEAIENAKPYDLELEMVSAQGAHKWIRTIALPIVHDGKVAKVQGIFQDITERKQIEKALQEAHDELELRVQERTAALSEANALLQALMDNMPDHIYFKDLQSRFIRNSKSQATLLGLNDPAEAVGKTDFDFFPHAARSYAEEQEVMRSGKPLVDIEEWVVWPDGRETWVSTTKLPLRNSEGQTIGIFGISHDITERKRTEQAIQQLNEDLEKQAEQLQAANKELEAFSYSVSHDLRAPLRAIDGYTRILVEDYEPLLDAEGKRICGIISREARRMGRLIDDLLAFSRLGRKQMFSSKIDMRTLAVSVLNELLTEADRGRLDFQIGKLPSAKGDSALIRQVWFNLLANAIKFTSRKEWAVIEVGCKTSKDELIYFVRDTGAGFDMEYANKLFGVFQRLHSESEFDGTGVGLAIVQRIILRHGGRVWAEGEVGRGATFYFALPRKEYPNE